MAPICTPLNFESILLTGSALANGRAATVIPKARLEYFMFFLWLMQEI
jgi:hypothetical protein